MLRDRKQKIAKKILSILMLGLFVFTVPVALAQEGDGEGDGDGVLFEPVEKQIKQPVVATSPGAKTSIKNTAPPVEQKKQTVVFSEQQLQHDDVIGNIDEQQKQAAEQNAQPIEKGTIEKDAAVAISDIPDSIRKRIPNIAFEGHVYSSTPKRRSVMINGHKRREGDTIGDDLLIKEITPAGAEFEFQGYRFRLNALQDWSFR